MTIQEPQDQAKQPQLRYSLLWLAAALVAAALFWIPRSGGEAEPAAVSGEVEPVARPTLEAAEVLAKPKTVEVPAGRVSVDSDEVAPTEIAPVPSRATPLPGAFLTLRAVDSKGQPALGVQFEWVLASPQGGLNDSSIEGVSDARGLLGVMEAPRWWQALFGDGELSDEDKMMAAFVKRAGVRPKLPFNELQPTDEEEAPGVLWLTEAPNLDATLDLVLPPFGYVDFQWEALRGGDGVLVDTYYLHVRRSDDGHFSGWRSGLYVEGGATHYRFGPIGLGWQVYGDLTATGVYSKLGSHRGPGPTVEGETVPFKIEFHDEQRTLAHVSGVVLDPAGNPLAEQAINVTFGDPGDKDTPRRTLATDSEGRWAYNLARSRLGAQIHVARSRVQPPLVGMRALDVADPEQTKFEVGEIRTQEVEPEESKVRLLASGLILDDADGAPLRRASASVYGHARTVRDKRKDPEKWTLLGSAYTGKDGAFSIEAEVDLADPRLQVRASEGDYRRQEPREVDLGASGLEFRLVRGAAVRLEVDIEPALAVTDAISLRFVGEGVSRNPSLMDFMGGYRGRFGGLESGKYELTIRLHGGNAVLHQQTVDVTGDVDLGTIDLKGLTALCHLRLVDAGGTLIRGSYVSVTDPASGVTIDSSARVDDRGRVSLRIPANLGAVVVQRSDVGSAEVPSSWFVPVEVEGELERRTLVL